MMKRKENERKSKEIVRVVYKRDKDKEGKQISIHFELFHHWMNKFTFTENDFTLICKPRNVKLKIEENNFTGKCFTPYQTKPKQIQSCSKWHVKNKGIIPPSYALSNEA